MVQPNIRQVTTVEEVVKMSGKDMWQIKKKVYAKQLKERLEEDESFKRKFPQTADHVRAIYKLGVDYERRRVVEHLMFGISVMSIALVFIECSAEASWIRIVNSILTILLLGCVIRRYGIEVDIEIGRGRLPHDVRLWELPSHLILGFLGEFIACAICVPLGIYGEFQVHQWLTRAQVQPNGTMYCQFAGVLADSNCFLVYSYPYQILGLFQLVRVYMIPRFVRNLSDYYSYRIAFIGSLNNVDSLGTLFGIKYLLRTRPFHFLAVSFLFSLLTTAYAVLLLEHEVNPLVSTYTSAVWLTVVTMATVGYGDRVPVTIPGQITIVVFAMVVGILLTGMLGASFFAMLELTAADHNVFELLMREQQAKTTANASARLIQAAWNIHQCRKRNVKLSTFQAASVLLFSAAQVCRKLRKSRPLDIPTTSDQLNLHFSQVRAAVVADFAQRKARLEALEATLDAIQL
ncbi:unnamed protein product [Aphanomyces euteiches]|uniref:Potassium channel domain-containing protein n=1 Tax=Aphanomyces euteiches TaxID=100861 RepID=A0A6G0WM49_9STRA|nr:hypothetical protein Ae201684_013741 [Aphanomyces euteiches]KAH9080967.1 hypothetical protein Ae201684P_008053 [Aphanomyces euteiches]KAH9144900.1 hypothetical protein AeRB84_011160 [Aphanomyces euteiches]